MGKSRYTGRIRIKGTPDGEAPKWVRKAWVGLILPCAPTMTFEKERKGVLSNKDTTKKDGDYIINVPQDASLRLLRRKSPEAAAWWEEHGYPNKQEMDFGFRLQEVEILEGVKPLRLVVADDMETGTMELPGR